MDTNKHIVIVGAGHAGGTVAALLRQHGATAAITLIGDESYVPYQRPPLSKAWLQGEAQAEQLYLKPAEFYEQRQIQWVPNKPVVALDKVAQYVQLEDGTQYGYDHLILACGARARALLIPGRELKGVHQLRGLDDANRLQQALETARHLVIVGGGFIGLEVAAAARQRGIKVTLVERENRLLTRLVSVPISAHVEQLHQSQGVNFVYGATVQAIYGQDQVQAIDLGELGHIACDTVLIGVGSEANLSLAQQAGLACEQGVLVNEQALTSDSNISAIGDMTQRPVLGHAASLRLESVPSALEQAKQVALRLVGKAIPALEAPWFWSDQYQSKIQIVGLPHGSEHSVVRSDPESGAVSVFHFAQSRLIAAECIQAPRDFLMARKAIAQAKPVDLRQFANTQVSLGALLQ